MSMKRIAKYVYVLYIIFKLYYFSTLHKDTWLLTPIFTSLFLFFPLVNVPQFCINQQLTKIVSRGVLVCGF